MEQKNSKYTLEGEVLVGISQTAWLSQIFLLLIILYVHFKRGFDGIVGGAGCYHLLPRASHVYFCKSLLLVGLFPYLFQHCITFCSTVFCFWPSPSFSFVLFLKAESLSTVQATLKLMVSSE